ncbi:hypothetical protein [Ferruginibacter sp.]
MLNVYSKSVSKLLAKREKYILLCFIFPLTLASCDNSEGLFGHSETKEQAKANGSTVIEYVPDKVTFDLLDGTQMKIDTAWTEVSFTYHNGNEILDSAYGFHFGIPFKIKDEKSFTFNFQLLDTTNRVFTNGRGRKICYLCPRTLHDTMKIILEQKTPDTSIGWLKPIITDTIIFTRINVNGL